MHYLLGGQQYYFPSSNEQSYSLEDFLDLKYNSENRLPIVVRTTALNINGRPMKHFLSKDIPLLLFDTHQFESILAEYYPLNDGKYHSTRRRLILHQGKSTTKSSSKFRSMKKLSSSLVTLTKANLPDDTSDDDYDNMRIIVRNLNKKHSSSSPLCRIPINYQGFFELLNENDQAVEPFHKLSELMITEYENENNQQKPIQKWPKAFFLRSTCLAYTKRYIPNERKLSGSADSCYGSLSDLDPQKSLLILNDDTVNLQPGQKITILNQCSAYRSQTLDKEVDNQEFVSQSSSSWFRNKSRFFFLKKKSQPTQTNNIPNRIKSKHRTKNIYDISKKSEPYIKCQTEQGDIVYLSIHEIGLFSSINSYNTNQLTSSIDTENIDMSRLFQMDDLLANFRFPLCVNLLNNSLSFDDIYAPASINQHESSILSLTKFRLLLPYTENVVFACPLIVPSSVKSKIIVIPIPINSDIEIQRCLNMREILANKYFHYLIQICSDITNRYKTDISYIHFPLVLNTTNKQMLKRKHPLFKKRSQSESHIEYYATDISKSNHRKSCEAFNYNDELNIENEHRISFQKNEKLYHRDSYEKIKQRLSNGNNNVIDLNQRQQSSRRSCHYAKIKIDTQRRYSRQQEIDSEDEDYRDLDHIYDYIRSGDVTDDVQRIQEKERVFNKKYMESDNSSNVSKSISHNESITTPKRSEKTTSSTNNNSKIKERNRSSRNHDDSKPCTNAFNNNNDDNDDDIPHRTYLASDGDAHNDSFEIAHSKPFIRTKRSRK